MSETADPSAAPPLLYLVVRLRAAGLPVSVEQYLEGLRALEAIDAPFQYLAPVARSAVESSSEIDRRRKRARNRLVWLVQTLWARTPEEREIARKVVETELPVASPVYALRLTAALTGRDPRTYVHPEPVPGPPPHEAANATPADEKNGAGTRGGDDADEKTSLEPAAPATLAPSVGDLIPLPDIEDTDLPRSHRFDLTEAQLVSPLWLTALWRRLREPCYVEDRTQIDVARTVERTVRSGGVLQIVHGRRRKNAARLLVFIDVGAAMAPWRSFSDEFARTLETDNSRLEEVTIRYFSGAPGRRVYAEPDLTMSHSLQEQLASAGAPVLVLGECGAARTPRADFRERLSSFLSATLACGARPLVWVNTMPKTRWQPAFRTLIQSYPHSHALTLGKESLLQAVDILRGQAR